MRLGGEGVASEEGDEVLEMVLVPISVSIIVWRKFRPSWSMRSDWNKSQDPEKQRDHMLKWKRDVIKILCTGIWYLLFLFPVRLAEHHLTSQDLLSSSAKWWVWTTLGFIQLKPSMSPQCLLWGQEEQEESQGRVHDSGSFCFFHSQKR
jgi:hypothetical protein